MGMFDNYENIASNYIPNNLMPKCSPCSPKQNCSCIDPCKTNKPYYADYNIEGELIGYWWYYGNALNLEFTIEGEVTLEDSSEYIPAEDFVKGKKVTMKIYNFRREVIYTTFLDIADDAEKANTVTFEIDQELSNKMVKGVYYCSLNLSDEKLGFDQTVLQLDECTINVR